MIRPDIEKIEKRVLRAQESFAGSIGVAFYVNDVAPLVAYIRELEADKELLDWLGEDGGSSPMYQDVEGCWSWRYIEGYNLGGKAFPTFREAAMAERERHKK